MCVCVCVLRPRPRFLSLQRAEAPGARRGGYGRAVEAAGAARAPPIAGCKHPPRARVVSARPRRRGGARRGVRGALDVRRGRGARPRPVAGRSRAGRSHWDPAAHRPRVRTSVRAAAVPARAWTEPSADTSVWDLAPGPRRHSAPSAAAVGGREHVESGPPKTAATVAARRRAVLGKQGAGEAAGGLVALTPARRNAVWRARRAQSAPRRCAPKARRVAALPKRASSPRATEIGIGKPFSDSLGFWSARAHLALAPAAARAGRSRGRCWWHRNVIRARR